jgi:hypothetical protein
VNPYQPPQAAAGAVPATVDRAKLRNVAKYQRYINLVVLGYFGTGAFSTQVTPELRGILAVLVLVVIVAGVWFAVQMARALYGTAIAIVCGLLLFVPCVGLITLLVLNNRATHQLRAAGLKVGLLGADPADVDRML